MNQKKGKWAKIVVTSVSLIMICLVLSVSSGFGLQNKAANNEFYPGDAVRITVIEIGRSADRETFNISGDYKINSLGNIMLPLIGNVKVVGHDRVTLANQLVELFSPYLKEPYITTMPLIRVTLMGAFNRPGSYRISPESSLWALIEMADGPRENCDLNSMRVERGRRILLKNLLEQFEKGYSLDDIGIRSGDQIIAKGKSNLGFRDIMSYIYFVMSAVSFYLTIRNYAK